MGMRIFNNTDAVSAHRSLNVTNNNLSKAMEKLSSGLRINRAADDAGGLGVSESMRSRYRGENVAMRNAEDGISLVQTADGAMGSAQDILQRMRDLAVQASNGTLTDAQRLNIDKEAQQLIAELDKVGSDTDFNGIKILSGSVAAAASAVTVQTGAVSGANVAFTIGTVTSTALTVNAIGVSTQTAAAAAIASIDTAITALSAERAKMGATQNRLEQVINRLGISSENLQAAESRIRDADMAQEMVKFTKYQILQQAGTAILAQANAQPQSVLQLLR